MGAMNQSVKKFIIDVAETCIRNNISFNLLAEEVIECGAGIEVSGYFDEKTLTVCTDKKEQEWLSILVHESSHMDQYLQQCEHWKNDYCVDVLDSWLAKEQDIKDDEIEECVQNCIMLELDCERRALRKIKKYKLPIDTELYIQKANSYLFSYWATFRYRKWYSFPYQRPTIYKKMPKVLLTADDYLNKYHDYIHLYK